MEFFAKWRPREIPPPTFLVPALGNLWDDTFQNARTANLGTGLAGAVKRAGGTGIMWDVEHDHYLWYEENFLPSGTTPKGSTLVPIPIGALIHRTTDDTYWRSTALSGATYVQETQASCIAKLDQRGYEMGTAIWTAFPACVLGIYSWKIAGSITDPQHGLALGQYHPWIDPADGSTNGIDFYMGGVMRAMKDLNAPGKIQLMDSEYYHQTETNATNISHDNAEKYGLQGMLSTLSQRLTDSVRDYMMPNFGLTAFQWASTDSTNYYRTNQVSLNQEPSYTDGAKRHRRWGMFGRRFEYTSFMTNSNGSPRGTNGTDQLIYIGLNAYSGPPGRTTGMVAATDPTTQDSTAILVQNLTQSRSGSTVTVTLDARHPYGIHYVKYTLYAANGTSVLRTGCAVMVWDISACGSSYPTLDFGGTNPTDVMHCTCTIPGATAGLYIILDIATPVAQHTYRRLRLT
jgi:hypothetical protein